jgi:hypothetical protein
MTSYSITIQSFHANRKKTLKRTKRIKRRRAADGRMQSGVSGARFSPDGCTAVPEPVKRLRKKRIAGVCRQQMTVCQPPGSSRTTYHFGYPYGFLTASFVFALVAGMLETDFDLEYDQGEDEV